VRGGRAIRGGHNGKIRPARMIVPGEVGQISVWEGVKIPRLMI
jgi:hypothetical protein